MCFISLISSGNWKGCYLSKYTKYLVREHAHPVCYQSFNCDSGKWFDQKHFYSYRFLTWITFNIEVILSFLSLGFGLWEYLQFLGAKVWRKTQEET